MDASNRAPGRSDPRFWLSASKVSLLGTDLLRDDRLVTLAVEDALWTFTMQDWSSRQPPAWRRIASHRWFAEGRELFEERERLQAVAYLCGLRK